MPIQFDPDAALSADKSGIFSGGYYKGIFTDCKIINGNDQAKFVEFAFESDAGETLGFIRVNTKKRNGEDSFGRGKIMALMGLLNIKSIEPVGEEARIIEFVDKPIASGASF